MRKIIEEVIRESIRAKEELLRSQAANIEKAAALIIAGLKAGHKVLIFGNGGSAADSQHFAAELVGRFRKERRPFPAVALTTNTSTLTAVANDYGYDKSFSRQVQALGKKGDIAVAISTSGNARNVVEAVRMARTCGLGVVGLTGGSGGSLKEVCDIAIIAGSADTARIQESHITIIHILCELIERWMLK